MPIVDILLVICAFCIIAGILILLSPVFMIKMDHKRVNTNIDISGKLIALGVILMLIAGFIHTCSIM